MLKKLQQTNPAQSKCVGFFLLDIYACRSLFQNPAIVGWPNCADFILLSMLQKFERREHG
jgi:hypothetical protein